MFISGSSNHCPVLLCSFLCKFFQRRKCHLSWQTHYSLINNASRHLLSHCCWVEGGRKKSPLFYFQILWFYVLYGKHRREWTHGKCILPWRSAFAAAGQQWPWEYSEATEDLSLSWKMESARKACFATATPQVPPLLEESKQAAGAITWHISIQFPLQNVFIFRLMACHFAGAFGQELILESKQIFRGAIFHQVLIFLHSRSLYSLI